RPLRLMEGTHPPFPETFAVPSRLPIIVLAAFLATAPAWAYVDGSPTLGPVIRESANIYVVEVVKVNVEKRVIFYRKVADLKGPAAPAEIRHALSDGCHLREPKTVLDLAEPGRLAVCFANGNIVRTCLGQYWYESTAIQAEGGAAWWRMSRGLPE